MDKNELKQLLQENLRFEFEERCEGHMSATEKWLLIKFDNEIIDSIRIGREECPGEWGG